jgi:hypothetical protein
MPGKTQDGGRTKSLPDGPENYEGLRQWVETWRRAGAELEEIRRREIEEMDTREAIRPIFGSAELFFRHLEAPTTSGLVEQQAWFAKLRR